MIHHNYGSGLIVSITLDSNSGEAVFFFFFHSNGRVFPSDFMEMKCVELSHNGGVTWPFNCSHFPLRSMEANSSRLHRNSAGFLNSSRRVSRPISRETVRHFIQLKIPPGKLECFKSFPRSQQINNNNKKSSASTTQEGTDAR